MRLLRFEITEALRIALAQIRAHQLRAALTALGVVIGIAAVTLMGTAIHGIDVGFNNSLALLGDDVLYVQKWPWVHVEDWWNYANRPTLHPEDAWKLNRIIDATPHSLLDFAVPVCQRSSSVQAAPNEADGVTAIGTTEGYAELLSADFQEGRLFNELEATAGRQVCVVGFAVAGTLFPGRPALGRTVLLQGHPFRVIGVLAHQGAFLSVFSTDNQMIVPLPAYRKFFHARGGGMQLRVKLKPGVNREDARDELLGAMRRVRGQAPGERDNFSINEEQAFKEQIDGVTAGIALGGLFITGLALFVGAIGIMNVTFVSVKERTREIGTRKALGARRRAILLQFLIEAVSICLAGGAIGLAATAGLSFGLHRWLPAIPLEFSPALVLLSLAVAVLTGVVAGFAPAWGASRLDPVVALRYE